MLFPVGCVSPGKRKKTTVTEVKTALAALPFPRKNSHLSNADNHPNKMSPRLRRRCDWFEDKTNHNDGVVWGTFCSGGCQRWKDGSSFWEKGARTKCPPDYAVVVIGFVLLLCGGTWIFQGRKHFIGLFLGKGRAANALMLFPVGCVSPGKRKKTTVTEVKTPGIA
jgi:hypothetical protein